MRQLLQNALVITGAFFFCKIPCNSQVVFNNSIDYMGGFEFAWSVILEADSSYSIIAGGEDEFSGQGIIFLRANYFGEALFENGYFNTGLYYYPGLSHTMKKLPDGNYYFVGGVEEYYPFDQDVIVAKLDSDGNTIIFNQIETGNIDAGYSSARTTDGGFAITGYISPDSVTSSNLLLMKVDSNGNLVWFHSYGSSKSDAGYSVYEIPGHRLIIAGIKRYTTTNYAPWIIITDSAGNNVRIDYQFFA